MHRCGSRGHDISHGNKNVLRGHRDDVETVGSMSLASRRRSWSERISGVATYRRHPNQRARNELPTELQRTTVPTYVRQWVERHAGAGVVRVRRLPGASSTAVHGIYFDDGKRLVLKRYIWSGLLRDEPVAPRRELEALAFAETNALPAPRVVGADVTGDELGDEVPAILMTFLPGVPVAVPDLSALAVVAAEVHATGPDGFGHDYFPWYEATVVSPPPATRRPALWEEAIALRSSAMPSYRPTFIHRDFHPGNVLWSRDRGAASSTGRTCAGVRGAATSPTAGRISSCSPAKTPPTSSWPPTNASPASNTTCTGSWRRSSSTAPNTGRRRAWPKASRGWPGRWKRSQGAIRPAPTSSDLTVRSRV